MAETTIKLVATSTVVLVLLAASLLGADANDAGAQGDDGTTTIFGIGDAHGLAIDSDDLPVVLATQLLPDPEFILPRTEEVTLIRCANVACDAPPRSSTVLPGPVDRMVLDNADRPILLTGFDDGDVEIIACADPACISFELRAWPLDIADFDNDVVTVEVFESGGLAIVASQLDPPGAVYHRCADALCESRTSLTIDDYVSSFTLDNAGLPAYVAGNELVRCADVDCATAESQQLPGTFGKLVFGPSGLPMVTVGSITPLSDLSSYTALAMHCRDRLCTDDGPWLPIAFFSSEPRAFPFGVHSLHVGPDGIPVWSQRFNTGFSGDLGDAISFNTLRECQDPGCLGLPSRNTRIVGASLVENTYFDVTDSGTPLLLFSQDDPNAEFFGEGRVLLTACLPGTTCFPDDNANAEADWLEPGVPWCDGQPATVVLSIGQEPTDGDDVIVGTIGDDVIAAGAGDDIICGITGNDRIWGQSGDDKIFTTSGNDFLRGGTGDDELRSRAGADDLNGGPGNDTVHGGFGSNVAVRGGTGDDWVIGGDGDDVLVAGNGGEDFVFGGAGDDKVTGGPRPDTVDGGPGNDVVKGNKGADALTGDDGDDELFGGPQPDTLDGGNGNDECNGGTTPLVDGEAAPIENDSAINCEAALNVP